MVTLKRQADGAIAPRASKRLKIKTRNEEAATVASTLFACTDIVSELFSFLDTKSLLQFSCVNNEFSALLTYQFVVRAAMMAGGYTATSLERMMWPIWNEMIWIPSPQRLLRLVCGKRCEKCCKPTRYVSPCIGMFLCTKCRLKYTEKVFRKNKMRQFLDCRRVQRVPRSGPKSNHMFLIKAPMQDSTGTRIGPVVTLEDICFMSNIKNKVTPREKVAAHVQECDRHQPDAKAAANAILKAVNENKGDATARKEAVLNAKLEGQKRFEAARKQRVDELLAALKNSLGEQVSWRSNLDHRDWKSCSNQYFFRDPILQGILKPMLKVPSKMNKKIVAEIPGRIQAAVDRRSLMDQYIQRILDFVNNDDCERVLRRSWNTECFDYNFYNYSIRKILDEPLKNPDTLKEEDVCELCEEVNSVVNRKRIGAVVLEKLSAKLQGVPFNEDVAGRFSHGSIWSYGFRRTHVQAILKEPLLKPEEITEERLDELTEQLRVVLEKKQTAYHQVNLLLEPTKKYTVWASRLNHWFWNSKKNSIRFHNCLAGQLLNSKLENMDTLTDEAIVSLSKDVIAAFEEKHGNPRS